MPTITAPGRGARSQQQAQYLAALGLRGLDSPGAIRVWNGNAGPQWTRLHRAVQAAVLRRSGHRARLLAYGWQQQDRGALHLHLLLGDTLASERVANRLYIAELDRLSPKYGFGFVDRKPNVKEASQAAAYLASYFCEGKGKKITLRESAVSGELPRVPIYVAHVLLKQTGVTMRSLRLKRFFWVRKGPGWLRLLDFLDLRVSDAYACWVMGGDDLLRAVINGRVLARAP
jgi:hypothetical protein